MAAEAKNFERLDEEGDDYEDEEDLDDYMDVEDGGSRDEYNEDGTLSFGVNKVWAADHGPHQVFVTVNVDVLTAIDTAQQTFEARFRVKQAFMMTKRDSELAAQEGTNTSDFTPEWVPPQLDFPRAVDFKVLEVSKYQLRQFAGMMVVEFVTRVHAIFGEPLELHSFPFDCQDLSISILWKVDEAVCKVWPSPGAANFVVVEADKMALAEWVVHPPIAEFSFQRVMGVSKQLRPVTERHPLLVLRLKVERVWTSYIYQIFLVMALICAAAGCAFTLPVDDSGGRLGHVTTMFLTAIAFQFVVSSMLPKLNYLTIVDKYILGCNLFITAVLFQVSLISYLQAKSGFEISSEVDAYLLAANAAVFLLIHAALVIYVSFVAIRSEKLKLTKSTVKLAALEAARAPVAIPSDSQTVFNDAEMRASLGAPAPEVPTADGRSSTLAATGAVGTQAASLSVYRGVVIGPGGGGTAGTSTKLGGIYTSSFGHGDEFFTASRMTDDEGRPHLGLRKITGDPNVPAGRLSLIVGWPSLGGPRVTGKMQIREDIKDKNGFSWVDAECWVPEVGEVHAFTWIITFTQFRIVAEGRLVDIAVLSVGQIRSVIMA